MQEHYVTATTTVEWTASLVLACRCGVVFEGLRHNALADYREHIKPVQEEPKSEPQKITSIQQLAKDFFGLDFDPSKTFPDQFKTAEKKS